MKTWRKRLPNQSEKR